MNLSYFIIDYAYISLCMFLPGMKLQEEVKKIMKNNYDYKALENKECRHLIVNS